MQYQRVTVHVDDLFHVFREQRGQEAAVIHQQGEAVGIPCHLVTRGQFVGHGVKRYFGVFLGAQFREKLPVGLCQVIGDDMKGETLSGSGSRGREHGYAAILDVAAVDGIGDVYHCRGFFGNVLLMHYLAVNVLEVGVELLVGALPAIVAP